MAAGLLDVDVLTGVEGQDGGGRVPVVRRGDQDGVHPLVVEHLAQVFDGPGGLLRPVLDELGRGRQTVAVHVADVGDLDVVPRGQRAEVVRPHAAGADDAEDDLAAVGGRSRGGPEGQGRGAEGGPLEEGPTSGGVHSPSSWVKETHAELRLSRGSLPPGP